MDVKAIVERVTEHGKGIADDSEVRYGTFSVGDLHWQGDVGVLRVCELPGGLEDNWAWGKQVAPGNTQGSRHTVDGKCKLLVWPEGGELVGPVVRSDQKWCLRHPEHGDVLFPAGDYLITYQRAYADVIRRVMD